jgi:imidazolonepropionase
LGNSNYAPYHKLKEANIEVAIATDYNPGSCNIQSMIFIITISSIFMKMDVLDAIYSSTYVPSKILNVSDECGSIDIGKNADIIGWDIHNPIQIPYKFSTSPIKSVIKSGKFIF